MVSFVDGSTEAHCLREVAGQSFLRGGLRADLRAAPAMARARAAPAPLPSTSPRSIAKAAAMAVSTRFVGRRAAVAPARGGRRRRRAAARPRLEHFAQSRR